jgi:hypothetical protein
VPTDLVSSRRCMMHACITNHFSITSLCSSRGGLLGVVRREACMGAARETHSTAHLFITTKSAGTSLLPMGRPHGGGTHGARLTTVRKADEFGALSTREGSLRSLFKSVLYPPKFENTSMVKMSDARIFSNFFLERRVLRVLRSHRGIVRPPAAIIDRTNRLTGGVRTDRSARVARSIIAARGRTIPRWDRRTRRSKKILEKKSVRPTF